MRHRAADILTAPFLVAVVLLGAAIFLSRPVAGWLNIKQGKKPLPLRMQLDALDENAMAPYRVKTRRVLEPTMVEALGTEMYLDWTLEDTSVPPNDPLRQVNLLVTYYSGGHDPVPHTPDVCYLGAGYAPARPHENTEVEAPRLGPGKSTVPIRVRRIRLPRPEPRTQQDRDICRQIGERVHTIGQQGQRRDQRPDDKLDR